MTRIINAILSMPDEDSMREIPVVVHYADDLDARVSPADDHDDEILASDGRNLGHVLYLSMPDDEAQMALRERGWNVV